MKRNLFDVCAELVVNATDYNTDVDYIEFYNTALKSDPNGKVYAAVAIYYDEGKLFCFTDIEDVEPSLARDLFFSVSIV